MNATELIALAAEHAALLEKYLRSDGIQRPADFERILTIEARINDVDLFASFSALSHDFRTGNLTLEDEAGAA